MKHRLNHLRRYHSTHSKILEIGPYFNPIFPKREFKNVYSLDVFSRENLINNAKKDKNVPPEKIKDIEEVDFLWAGSLANSIKIKGQKFGLIVSSHNFEHQPNPIKFLLDSERLLDKDGVLTMAIPIATRCFDVLRPLTTTGNWLDRMRSRRPTGGVVFDCMRNLAEHPKCHIMDHGTYAPGDLKLFGPRIDREFYKDTIQNNNKYIDSHCTVFIPESFLLILYDLAKMEILRKLKVFELTVGDFEFVVHLSKSREPLPFYGKEPKEVSLECVRAYYREQKSFFQMEE